MEYGSVPGIDKPVSRLVQGTTMLSSAQEAYSFELLDAIYDLGCRTFDTAHVYGNGDCERTFGAWLRRRGVRDQVVILGKGAHLSRDRRRVTPYDITADLHDSLARMGVDFIDLYVLHRDDPDVPVGPIVEVLNEHLRAGKIRAIGGSNWSHTRIAEANRYAADHGLTPFVVSSPNFSLAVQAEVPWEGCISVSGPDGATARAWYLEQKMPLFTWSSLAGGFLTGRFRRDNLQSFDHPADRLVVRCYCTEENFARLDRVTELAQRKGLTVPQIALAYTLSQPLEIFPLVGCRSGEEFAENIVASQVILTPDEISWIG